MSMFVTDRACARSAPTIAMAELKRSIHQEEAAGPRTIAVAPQGKPTDLRLRPMTARVRVKEESASARRRSPRMRGPAACRGGKAPVPSPFAAIVRGVKSPTSFIFPPQFSRGSDCPGQKPMQIPARSSRPLCSQYPSVTSVLKREPSNQAVLPMPASLMSAACVAVSLSADTADL